MGESRLKTCQQWATELVRSTRDMTVYEAYGGVLGNLLLRPAWLAQSQSSECNKMEVERHVLLWVHAILAFVQTQTQENKISEEMILRYRVLGFGAIVKLVVRALKIVGKSGILFTATHFPKLIDFLFQRVTERHRSILMETLVKELQAHSRVAFDSLNLLLETQIKRGSDDSTVVFFKYLPAFVLPVIQAIQA